MQRLDSKGSVKKCFEASDDQLNEYFSILEEETDFRFLEERHFLHAHRTGSTLPSKAADELRRSFRDMYKTVVIPGVSGCGKSHAIYLNVLHRTCLYFTPNSWLMKNFNMECHSIRLKYVLTIGLLEDGEDAVKMGPGSWFNL